MSYEMTLIGKTSRRRNDCEREATQDELLCGRNPYLRLEGMWGHANLPGEHAIQVKRAKANQSREFSQGDNAIVMSGNVITRCFHRIVFVSGRP